MVLKRLNIFKCSQNRAEKSSLKAILVSCKIMFSLTWPLSFSISLPVANSNLNIWNDILQVLHFGKSPAFFEDTRVTPMCATLCNKDYSNCSRILEAFPSFSVFIIFEPFSLLRPGRPFRPCGPPRIQIYQVVFTLKTSWKAHIIPGLEELAKFSEELAACAMEDVALSAWPGDVSTLRHEHLSCKVLEGWGKRRQEM